jgi:hypothetical protein
MIDRGCPVQINRIFGSKKIYFLSYGLYFSVNRGGARAPAGAYLGSAAEFIYGQVRVSLCLGLIKSSRWFARNLFGINLLLARVLMN